MFYNKKLEQKYFYLPMICRTHKKSTSIYNDLNDFNNNIKKEAVT